MNGHDYELKRWIRRREQRRASSDKTLYASIYLEKGGEKLELLVAGGKFKIVVLLFLHRHYDIVIILS